MTAIEEALYQTQNQSRQDPLNFPIRLNNKLTSLMQIVENSEGRPTQQAYAVKAELSAAIEAELSALQRIWEDRIPALNQQVRDSAIDAIVVDAD